MGAVLVGELGPVFLCALIAFIILIDYIPTTRVFIRFGQLNILTRYTCIFIYCFHCVIYLLLMLCIYNHAHYIVFLFAYVVKLIGIFYLFLNITDAHPFAHH